MAWPWRPRMRDPLRLPVLLALASRLVLAVPGGVAPQNPCAPNNACGTVTAEPIGSSSSAQGEATGAVTWERCLSTKYPYTTTCLTSYGLAYAGVLTGPSAGCAKGVLRADAHVVDETPRIC